MVSIWNGDAPTDAGSTTLSVAEHEPFLRELSNICFHSLDSAPVLPWAPPPDKHVTGVGFPMASRAPKLVVSPRYLEPFM
jgi:hypothetical protein